MNKLEKECENAKNEFDRKDCGIRTKFNHSISRIMSLIICRTTAIQRQNEMILVFKSAINEWLKYNKITNQVTRSLLSSNDGYQQHSDVTDQLATIPIDVRCESIEKLFATYSPLIEDCTKKIMEVANQLLVTNER